MPLGDWSSPSHQDLGIFSAKGIHGEMEVLQSLQLPSQVSPLGKIERGIPLLQILKKTLLV